VCTAGKHISSAFGLVLGCFAAWGQRGLGPCLLLPMHKVRGKGFALGDFRAECFGNACWQVHSPFASRRVFLTDGSTSIQPASEVGFVSDTALCLQEAFQLAQGVCVLLGPRPQGSYRGLCCLL
jgi:hypothetical protein